MNLISQLQHIDYFYKTNHNKDKSPVLVKFNSMIAKNLVLKTKKILKPSENLPNITIKEDFPPAIRRIREQLFLYLSEAKKNNCKATIRYDKLIIYSQIFILEELQAQKFYRERHRK